MSEWNRSTRKISLEEIRPALTEKIQEHLERFNLGSILDDYTICVETVSVKKKKGLFGRGGGQQTAQIVILTPTWLVISVESEKPGSAATLSVKLEDAFAEDYAETPHYKLIADNGIQVTGEFTGRVGMQGENRIMYFLGLGEEPAAREFKELLFQGIKNTRR